MGARGEAPTPSHGRQGSDWDVDLHGDKLLFGSIRPIINHSLMINVSSWSVSLWQQDVNEPYSALTFQAYVLSLSL